MRSKAWKELGRRAGNLYPALCNLETLTTDELRGLRAVCGMVSQTNCAWTEYLLAPILVREINSEFMRRANIRRNKGSKSSKDSKP